MYVFHNHNHHHHHHIYSNNNVCVNMSWPITKNYIPLISRVRGPYGKLWTEFFPSFYENKEGKNEDP